MTLAKAFKKTGVLSRKIIVASALYSPPAACFYADIGYNLTVR
jgi:hypothetical protein